MKIEKRELELPRGWDGKLAFALDNVFTKEECEKYIADSEARGYELALVNIGGGRQKQMTDVRNSSRNIWDSKEEVQKMFSRIKDYIPEVWKDRKCLGLNERLRFLRYDPGEYFKPHLDGSYVRENGERSYITVQIYLNEGFEGGSTTFMSWDENERVEYVPKTGSVLIFQHDILHEGSQLIKGRKYSIRTDVMYSLETVQELKKGKKSKLLSWLPW
ncbi:hypothetical protein FSP39_022883 [Pinctada imbricata]|uniref:Fe2OG dioxygenase domain-containing protein n=1 Tax=Pinctada imbricata TaxID=66713 RepID=A0AA88YLT3_PINIB|nr:hypothetical protein FSP39_022883 [Pinctada imbricata]